MAPGETLRARWFHYSLLALVCWGGFALFAKFGSREIPPEPMQFLFAMGSLPVCLGLLIGRRFRLEKSGKGILFGISSGVLSAVGGIALFAAYHTNGNTSVITASSSLYPVITVILAISILKEKFNLVQAAGLGFAALAILIFSLKGGPMVHLAPWLWLVGVTLLSWGVVGLLQKLSTDYISAESSLIWLVAGYLLLEPFLYPGKMLLTYSRWNLMWALLSGAMNALGAWALFAAFTKGGKASIVAPITSLYPLVVVLVAPFVLHESMTRLQGLGIACSVIAVVCLSA